MNELMSFLQNTNLGSLENNSLDDMSLETQNLENQNLENQFVNFATTNITTLNPLYEKPRNYKIDVEGYGTVAETPDKFGPSSTVNYQGKTIHLVSDQDKVSVITGSESFGNTTGTKTKNTTKLYEINLEHLDNLGKERTKIDLAYSTMVLSQLNRSVVIGGKTYSVGQLEQIYNDPKQLDLQKKITEQARKLGTDPALNPDVLWELSMLDVNAVMLEGRIAANAKKFNQSLLATTMYADARLHAKNHDKNGKPTKDYINATKNGVITESHSFLFKQDGSLKTFEEFATDYINKVLPSYNNAATQYKNQIVATNQTRYIINDKGERVANNMYKMKEEQEAQYWENQRKSQNALLSGDRPIAVRTGIPGVGPGLTPTIYGRDKQGNIVALNPYTTSLNELDPALNPVFAERIKEARQYRAMADPFGMPGDDARIEARQQETKGNKNVPIINYAVTTKNWQVALRDMGKGFGGMGNEQGINIFNYRNLKENYDAYLSRVVNEYNLHGQPTAFKLAAEEQSEYQNKFINNKGGEIKGTKQSFSLDLSNPVAYVETINKVDPVTGETKPEKKIHLTPEARHFKEIYNLVRDDQGNLRYSIGQIGEIPEDNEFRDPIYQLLLEMYTGSTRRKDGKIEGKPPRGTVSYQGVVAGQTEYHAFHFQLDQDYLNQGKFKGTESQKGILKKFPELLTGGFTIYVPRELSETKTTFGIQNFNTRTISSTEALMAINGSIDLNLPNSGNINITKNNTDGTYDINGYNVLLNPNTLGMDTTRFETIKVPYSNTYDLDLNVQDIITNQFYLNYRYNRELYKELLIRQGEKDPNKLMLRVPYAPPQK